MILEAIENFYNKPKEKKRELGKYHASELWSIYKGYTTTGNFFTQKNFDETGKANVFRGSAMEDMLAKVLTEEKIEFTQQERLDLNLGSCIISGKLDFNFQDFVLETKCPRDLTNGVPDKWSWQLEFYHRTSEKKVYLGIFDKEGDHIIRFFPFEPSDERWELIKKTVSDFNSKLLKRYAKRDLPS